MDKFTGTSDLPVLNWEVETTYTHLRQAIKCLPTEKGRVPNGITAEVYQTFEEKTNSLKLFHKIERKKIPKLVFQSQDYLYTQPGKSRTEEKKERKR